MVNIAIFSVEMDVLPHKANPSQTQTQRSLNTMKMCSTKYNLLWQGHLFSHGIFS